MQRLRAFVSTVSFSLRPGFGKLIPSRPFRGARRGLTASFATDETGSPSTMLPSRTKSGETLLLMFLTVGIAAGQVVAKLVEGRRSETCVSCFFWVGSGLATRF